MSLYSIEDNSKAYKEKEGINLEELFRGIEEPINYENQSDNYLKQLCEIPNDVSTNSMDFNYKFTEDKEIKLQPMIRKSRKQFTPEEKKDERYWDKRAKNNYAAKRSRETRRMRENQLVLRANYLERENSYLNKVLKKLSEENDRLKKSLIQ